VVLDYRKAKDALVDKKREEFIMHFKIFLYSVASLVSVGRSVSNAIKEAYVEVGLYLENERKPIMMELNEVMKKLEGGRSVEWSIKGFAERVQVEAVEDFATLFAVNYKKGGDITKLIKMSSKIITDKIDTRMEIDLILSGKKYEVKIMKGMPYVLIAALRWSVPDYVAPLYETLIGRLIMTLTGVFVIIASYIADRLIDIEV